LNISAKLCAVTFDGDRTEGFGAGRDEGRRDSMISARHTAVLAAALGLTIVSVTAMAQQPRRVNDQQVQAALNLIAARSTPIGGVR
jgi:hypothetical protein